MALLGIDLGATKVTFAVLSEDGQFMSKNTILLEGRKGKEVGTLITDQIKIFLEASESNGNKISSIGISVPGISHTETGTVWAPNIPGWDDYHLLQEVNNVTRDIPVTIDSDRACYILGETWMGNAMGCRNAIYLAVGTGIGAGILVDGEVLRGSNDIAGAIGWMALNRPFNNKYSSCGCFEYHASGEGIAKVVKDYIMTGDELPGKLGDKPFDELTSHDVFIAYEEGNELAERIIRECIGYWGMAVANLISLFNPEKIILGGGIFGPARRLIPEIINEAGKWSQPISFSQVMIEESALAGDAGVLGAGYLALRRIKKNR
jgi:glucokinase